MRRCAMGFYDFTVKDRQGKDVFLKDYQGKVVLVVNTATDCGFNYEIGRASCRERV